MTYRCVSKKPFFSLFLSLSLLVILREKHFFSRTRNGTIERNKSSALFSWLLFFAETIRDESARASDEKNNDAAKHIGNREPRVIHKRIEPETGRCDRAIERTLILAMKHVGSDASRRRLFRGMVF